MKSILRILEGRKFSTIVKIFIFTMVISLLCSFLFTKIALPGALDLPRQIQNGEDIVKGNFDVITKNVYSYVEPGQPFANHHWFYGVISYLLYESIGWIGITILKVLFIIFSFILLFWIAMKRSDFWLTVIFSIPTTFILISRTAFRPEIFSYFFLVIFLFILFDAEKNPKSNKLFWLLPIQLIWVNTHIFFPIGILLTAGFLFEKLVIGFKKWRGDRFITKLSILLGGLVLISFLNPYGLMGVVRSLAVNTAPDFPIHSMEISNIFAATVMDPSFSNVSIYVYLYSIVFLGLCFIATFIYRLRNKKYIFSNNFIFLFLASVGSAGLSFFIFRALPLFGAIFLISVCSMSKDIFYSITVWINKQDIKIQKILYIKFILILTAVIIYLIFLGQHKMMQYQEQGFGLARDSLGTVDFFKNNGLKGPIFNDTDSGSYLIGTLYPKEKVFSDNRFGDAYSANFFSDIYLPMIQNETSWQEGLKKYNFNTIIMYHYDMGDGVRDFIFRRVYDPEWAWVYVDKYNIVLVRNNDYNKAIIDKYRITHDTVYERIKYLIESNHAKDKLNAADIFNLVGRTDLSIPTYLQYLSLKPNNGEIWFVLGRTELQKAEQGESDPSLAAVFIERAIENGWTTWQAYSYLALAYHRTGQFERVKEMVKKEEKILPKGEDTQIWLKIIKDKEEEIKNEQ